MREKTWLIPMIGKLFPKNILRYIPYDMKVIFKVIKAGSGNDVYFQRLSDALKLVKIDSVIEYYPKYFQYFPWALKLVNKKTPGDIIHSNVEYGWVFKENDKPLYVTLHHNVFDKEYRKYTGFSQRIFHDFIIKPNTLKSLKSVKFPNFK